MCEYTGSRATTVTRYVPKALTSSSKSLCDTGVDYKAHMN